MFLSSVRASQDCAAPEFNLMMMVASEREEKEAALLLFFRGRVVPAVQNQCLRLVQPGKVPSLPST